MKNKIEQLETLAREVIGDGMQPNCFFVTHNGTVCLISADFNTAYERFLDLLRRGVDCTLEDRRQGVVCCYSRDEGDAWKATDETAAGYYAVLRVHGPEAAQEWESIWG